MRYCLFIFAVLLTQQGIAQSKKKEFEGFIRYNHRYIFNSLDIDTTEFKKSVGTSSVWYYKEGNYKWVINAAVEFEEYMDDATQVVYYRYANNPDTIFISPAVSNYDSLGSYKNLKNIASIAGYKCKSSEVIVYTDGNPEVEWKRTIFYSDEAVYIPTGRFHSYKTFATDKVTPKINSWPLRIELQIRDFPNVILEAVEVVPQKLSLSDVVKPDLPIKQQ